MKHERRGAREHLGYEARKTQEHVRYEACSARNACAVRR